MTTYPKIIQKFKPRDPKVYSSGSCVSCSERTTGLVLVATSPRPADRESEHCCAPCQQLPESGLMSIVVEAWNRAEV